MSFSEGENLYQRNGVWWARVQVNGRDIRRSLRTPSRPEAQRRLRKLLKEAEDARAAGVLPERPRTWQDAVVRWSELHMSELKPASQRRYLVSLRQIAPHFDGRPVGTLTPRDVATYVAARKRGGASGPTIRRDLAVMARVFKAAKRAGWCEANPVPEEKAEIRENKLTVRPVPLRHIAAVIRAARTDMAPPWPAMAELIAFLARTGARLDEAVTLEWRDVDLPGRRITFRQTKTSMPRVIRLTARTAAWMGSFAQPRKPDAQGRRLVFRARNGGPLGSPSQRFARCLERAGVPHFRCHDLRHTYGIRRLLADQRMGRTDDQERGIVALARHMGHTSTKTTEIYVRWLLAPTV